MAASDELIRLEGVTKVFFTDEVETHALSGIHLEIEQGRVRLDRRAVGLRQVDAALDPRPARLADRRARITLNGRPVAGPDGRPSARASATARSGSSSRAST